jgi:hypothetical protein
MTPNPDSALLMSQIDSLPKRWRALVYEYGVVAVSECREQGMSLQDADDSLWMARSARQAAWLATDYITKRSQMAWGN